MSTDYTIPYQASPRNLARASGVAIAAAATLLVLFVLPAEYGIDPTGIGKAIGLTALAPGTDDTEPAAPAAPVTMAASKPIAVPDQTRETIIRATAYRSDERTLTVAPHSGVEIKAEMQTGDQFVFAWKATGPVKMDMHGERSLKSETATTYWKEKGLTQAQGSLTAPFTGIHGWYWRNQGETPVTITLRTSGFYAKLIQPDVG